MLVVDNSIPHDLKPGEALIQVRRKDGTLSLCVGVPMTFPGWEGWTFFLDHRGSEWIVSELTTGCRFAEGTSRQEAAARAVHTLMTHGREALKLKIEEKLQRLGPANQPGRVTARMVRCENCGASYYPWEDHSCDNAIGQAA